MLNAHKMIIGLVAPLALFAVLGHASPAFAAAVTVPGFGFEAPVVATFNSGEPTDWNDAGFNSGLQAHSLIGFTGGEGAQAAYANFSEGLWSEASLGTITADTTYTLTVAVANRVDFSSTSFELALFAGSPGSGGTSFATTGAVAISPTNAFSDYQLTTTVLTGNAAVGSGLYIYLHNTGGAGQIVFDNVRLDASPASSTSVPAPAALPAGLVLIAACAIRRRR